jgi:glucokinase
MKDAALAIDVGATKVAVGLVARDGAVLDRVDISSKAATLQERND